MNNIPRDVLLRICYTSKKYKTDTFLYSVIKKRSQKTSENVAELRMA